MSGKFSTEIAIVLLVALFLHKVQSSRLAVDILDDAKRAILKEFTSMVENDLPQGYMKDERYLIRYLDRSMFNVHTAKEYLKEAMQLREEENVDRILDEDWSDMEARFPYQLQMVNKEGRPVLYYNYGEWDVRAEIDNGGYDRLLRYASVKLMEEAERRTRALRSGDEPLQFDIITNLDGYSMDKHGCLMCLRFYKSISDRALQYSGAVDKTYFVNTPYIFEKAFNIVVGTTLVDWSRQSTFMLGGKESYGPVLADIIDVNQLPNSLK